LELAKKFERDGTVEDAPSRLQSFRWPEEFLEYVEFFVENDLTFLIEETHLVILSIDQSFFREMATRQKQPEKYVREHS
jgi:hypothetical protein